MVFDFSSLAFSGVPQKKITLESICEILADNNPRRINFASTHSNALRRASDKPGKIILPFTDTVLPFINYELGSDVGLFPSKFGGYWRLINTEEEHTEIGELE